MPRKEGLSDAHSDGALDGDAQSYGMGECSEAFVSRGSAGVTGSEHLRAEIRAYRADAELTSLVEGLQEFCGSLLLLARTQAIECEVLRERLGRTEEELEKSENLAEDLYQFFSRTAQRVARDEREPKALTAGEMAELLARNLGEEGGRQG